MLRYPFKNFTYQEFSDINNFPLINSPLFLVTVFIAGYVFVLKEDKKIEEEEVTHAEK